MDESDEVVMRRDALAYVCTHLEGIRSDLRSGLIGDDAPLEDLLAAVRAGRDVAGPLDALHAVLQADGDPQGLYGVVRGISPVGVGRARPGETVYLCPARLCKREWQRETPSSPVPRCEISGDPLRRDRL